MNRPLVPLLIVLALLWRGLLPAGVMAVPGESGIEIRLCGLTGGSVVLDLGLDNAHDGAEQGDLSMACPACALSGALDGAYTSTAWVSAAMDAPAEAFYRPSIAPRGPPLRVTARGPPTLI